MNTNPKKQEELHDCSGCTDRHSEGTHANHTKQHPCPEGGDPNCGYCFPNPEKWEIGEKVKIIQGRYEGQTATIRSLLGNGAMVERDVTEERRFCPVQFIHLARLSNNKE